MEVNKVIAGAALAIGVGIGTAALGTGVALAPHHITVKTVAPGPLGADFTGGVMRDREQVKFL
jgi:hypothetical protein